MEYFGGDFFDETKMPKIEDGDVLILRYVLHNWSDEDALKILKTLRALIGDKKARILIGESVMKDRDRGTLSPSVHLLNLEMTVLFGNAKARAPKQWQNMLLAADFGLDAIHPIQSSLSWSSMHWVECSPLPSYQSRFLLPKRASVYMNNVHRLVNNVVMEKRVQNENGSSNTYSFDVECVDDIFPFQRMPFYNATV